MKYFFLSLILFTGLFSNSQVTVDPTFNPIDTVSYNFRGARGTVYAQVIQSDGKILIGGNMQGYNNFQSTTTGNLVRLNTDGARDAGFGVTNGANNTIFAIALQNDGKILIGGDFTTYAGITVNGICRLNSNGSFDPSFNPALGIGGSGTAIRAIKVLENGKILIGGDFTTYNTNAVNGFCRINSDGSYDNTFNAGGSGFASNSSTPLIRAIELQTDGKILVGGLFTTYNGTSRPSLIRLNTDGSRDMTFTVSNVVPGQVNTIKLRSDNKIWIGCKGGYLSSSPFPYPIGIFLLNTDGTNDASFNPGQGIGPVNNDFEINTITPIGASKLFIGGRFNTYNSVTRTAMAIINTNGTLDATVLTASLYPTDPLQGTFIYSSTLDGQNNILYSGRFNNSISLRNNNIDRINSSYELDLNLNPILGANNTIKTFAMQSDGKIIIGGIFSRYNNIERARLARLTADGELDNTYIVGTGVNNDVNDIAVQANGNIIAVGNFTNYNSTNVNRIVRTNANGVIDATFATNIGSGANGEINSIALQTDGKIIIGGNFTIFNGNSSNYLARLNSDGTFDNTFNIGTGFFGLVRVVRVQTDGKILVGGDFQFFNGNSFGRILRLNTNGSVDNTFNSGGMGMSSRVFDIALTQSGDIFIAGEGSYNNSPSSGTLIIKLTPSGGIDNSFIRGTIGSVNRANSIKVYPDGKVLASIGFDEVGYRLYRFNTSGSLDNTFITSFNLSTLAFRKLELLSNRILVSGEFSTSGQNGRNRIARLIDASISVVPLTLQNFTGNLQNGHTILNWQTIHEINTDKFTIERSTNNTSFTAIGSTIAKGNSMNTYQFTDFNTSNLGATTLFYRLKMVDKNGSFTYSTTIPIKLIKQSSILLLPNPAKNTVWLQIQQTTNQKISISVSDISGKTIMQLNPTISIGTTSLPLDVSKLSFGVYYVTVRSNNTNETLKLIKE